MHQRGLIESFSVKKRGGRVFYEKEQRFLPRHRRGYPGLKKLSEKLFNTLTPLILGGS